VELVIVALIVIFLVLGIIGSFIPVIPGLGIILGSFLGSFIGAKIESIKNPVNIAFGTVIGFMFGSVLKFVLSIYILFLIFIK